MRCHIERVSESMRGCTYECSSEQASPPPPWGRARHRAKDGIRSSKSNINTIYNITKYIIKQNQIINTIYDIKKVSVSVGGGVCACSRRG